MTDETTTNLRRDPRPLTARRASEFPITDAVLVIHGGAGTIRREGMTPERAAAYLDALADALRIGYAALRRAEGQKDAALSAVCAAVTRMEDDPLFNAGRGAVYTFDGTHELDAAVMDGATGRAGAVAGVRTVANPVLLAREVLEHSPFVLLAGAGAETFARTRGIPAVPPEYFATEERRRQLDLLRAEQARESEPVWDSAAAARLAEGNAAATASEPAPDGKFGTVGAVARDRNGRLAAATSTGGMTGKRFGRIGDSPLLGAGTWAANAGEFGCAVSATGHGERFIEQAVAHDIYARMVYGGVTVAEAADAVVHGTLAAVGGLGGVIALDPRGNAALPFNTPGMYRGLLRENGDILVGLYGGDTASAAGL